MASLIGALLRDASPEDLQQLADALKPYLGDVRSDLMTAEEVAVKLRASSVQRVYDLVYRGKLDPIRDGRRLLFSPDEVREHLNQD